MARIKKKKNLIDTYDFKKFKANIKKDITNNVKVNVILAPAYFLLVFFLLKNEVNIPLYKPFYGSVSFYSLISTLVYIYSSHYFQPDLDVYENRPGMGHFPLGKTISNFRIGRFLKWVFYPINRFWYHLWTPYARMFTHRGVTHWPILSTIIRVSYLLIVCTSFQWVMNKIGFSFKFLDEIVFWLKNFFLNFDFFYFILFNFPIYVTDLAHIVVDYYDSAKRGISFCSPKLPRGIFAQLYESIKGGRDL